MSRPSSSLGFSLPTSATNDHDLFTMDYLRSFNAARTDEQRFRVAHARLALLRALPTRSERNPKSSTLSRELRVAGNAEFSRDRAAALRRYNESIATAPRGTEELALGYGNRSALYHSTGNYAAALADIGRALGSGGYADHLKTKLYERRAACFKALGRMREAADSLQEAINFLPLARSPRADKLETLTSALRSVGGMADERATLGDQRAAPVKSYGENREIPSASNCLRIAHDPEMGRHIVSTRDIRPGDILVIEKPYASVLTPASYSTHCYNCLKRSDAMIPCQDCTLVMFCSEECRSISWRTFHRLECPILGAALGLDMEHEIKLLALRTLLVACHTSGGLGGLRELVRELQDNTEVRTQDSDPEVTLSPGENAATEQGTRGSEPDGRYLSSSYTALHWLERHSDNARPPMLNLFAMTAANLVAHLRLSTDLFAGTTGPEADWSVLAGALLMRYMRIAQFNSFRIEEATLSRHGGLRGESYAGGIYNLLSLCNHACWPNAARFFCHGDTKVLFAQLPIKKGEQICVTYAGDFRKLCLSERRKTQLDSFYFECACVACEGDWPVYRHLTSVPVLTCGRCRAQLRARGRRAKTLTCDKCRAKRSVGGLDLAAKRMRDVAAEIDCVRSPPADVTARLVELLEELYESVAMPFLPTVDCQDLISKSFYRTVGNFYVL